MENAESKELEFQLKLFHVWDFDLENISVSLRASLCNAQRTIHVFADYINVYVSKADREKVNALKMLSAIYL